MMHLINQPLKKEREKWKILRILRYQANRS